MPTLFKRSNGIYYAILADDLGRRKWISTGEHNKSLARKRLGRLSEERRTSHRSLTILEFQSQFVEYAKGVYSTENVGIYEKSFRCLVRHIGNIRLDAVDQRHVDLLRGQRLENSSLLPKLSIR